MSEGTQLKFVILGTQRTGSTLIRTCLDSHPDIRCFGELFAQRDERPHSYAGFVTSSLSHRLLHYVGRKHLIYRYLDQLPDKDDDRTYGFKVMYSQLQGFRYGFPMILDYLSDHRVKVLHVVRKNVLKMAVSRVRAWSTGIWHSSAKERKGPATIELDTQTLLSILKKLKRIEDEWRARLGRLDTLEVAYEGFVDDQATSTAQILGFLGVEPGPPLVSHLKKVTPDSLGDVVTNFSAVRALLAGTEFEWCLDDSPTRAGPTR